MQITVEEGDITRFVGDALVVPIILSKDNHDYLNLALRAAAGTYYHDQLAARLQVRDYGLSQTIYVPRPPQSELPFGDVLFAVDALKASLRTVIAQVLAQAEAQMIQTLLLPPLRTGEWGGLFHERAGTPAYELVLALREFAYDKPRFVRRVACVVQNNPGVAHQLRGLLTYSAS